MTSDTSIRPAPPRLHFSVAPEPSRLLRARERIRDYLTLHCADESTINDVVLAIEEACTNAIRHSGSEKDIEIGLRFEGERLRAVVTDKGRGFDIDAFDANRLPDPLLDHGRGLYLISRLCDELHLRHGGGVTVEMVKSDLAAQSPPLGTVGPFGHETDYWQRRERFLREEMAEAFASLDWEYRFTYANRAAVNFFTMRLEDGLGKSFWEIFPATRDMAIGQAVRRAMELGVSSIEEYASPTMGRWVECRVYPTGSGVSLYLRDIDERKHKELERDELFERLGTNQAMLERSQQLAHLGSWELDPVSGQLTWSDEVYRIFGLEPQEFGATYEAFLERVHPEDRAAVDAAYSGSLREDRDSYEIEHRVVRKDSGEIRYVQERCDHLRDATGKIVRSVGMVHDITVGKLAEQALERSHRRAELLAWTASSLLSTDDPMGLVDELCRKVMTELDCDVFLNHVVDEDQGRLRLSAYAGISADEAKRIEWLDRDVMGGACEVEKELLAAHGVTAYACHPLMVQEEVLGTLSFGTTTRPHFSDDDLALMKAVADHMAMTFHHRRAENERRRYELLATDSRDIMLFMDREGRLLDANLAAEQAYGYSRAELLALTIAELRAPDAHDDPHIEMAGADDTGALFETAHRRKDGSVFPVEVSTRGATIGGRVTLMSVVRDISERKRAEETLSRNLATLARSQEIGRIGSWALDFETGAFEASDEDYRIYGLVPGSAALLDLVWTLVHPDDLDRYREYVEAVQHEGRLGGIDYRIVRPDGVRHVYAETATVVRGPDGKVRLASGITQDITERKLAELEMLERARLSDALTSIDALVHSSLDTSKAVESALSEGAIALGASTAVVTTHQDGGFRIDHLFGAPTAELGRVVPDEHDPAGLAALATREPVVMEDAQSDPRMSPVIAERYGVRSLLVVPLASERDAVGCLYFVFQERPHVFTQAEVDFGRKLGATLSLAIENARLYEDQRRIAVTLQENFVHELPSVPGLEIGMIAQSAVAPGLVGGDFSDAFVLDDGQVAILIGDVAGKGIEAAGLTETVRSTVRALAAVDPSPAFVLGKTNGLLLRHDPDGPHVTAFYCLLDPRTGHLAYASAGHPAPIHLGPTTCRLLAVRFGPPLGSFEHRYESAHTTLTLDDYLVLYTDGVTEARHRRELYSEGRLLEVVAELRGQPAQLMAENLLGAVETYADRLLDDIQVLTLRLA